MSLTTYAPARFTLATLSIDSAAPVWMWAVVVGIAAAILVATYASIHRQSGRKLTWLLCALRAMGVAALLVAMIKPVWVSSRTTSQRPVLAVILDDSQSMSVQHTVGDLAASRYALALNWWNEDDAARRLRDRFDVHLYDIAGSPLTAGFAAEPAAEQTDLVRPLRDVANHFMGRHAAGVVIISDGRDTTGRDNVMAMREYPLPIYAIGYAPRPPGAAAAADLAIISLDAPQRALVHNQVPVRLLITSTADRTIDTHVQIERADQVIHTQPLRIEAGARSVPVTLSFTPADAGDFVLTARVMPAADERNVADNARQFRLRVDATPIRVLYIEGELRPEFTFLSEALHNDPDVELISFVRSAHPDIAALSGASGAEELLTPERLEKIDVVLLGDFESSMLPQHAYEALGRRVEAGGSLMVLGGYRNLGAFGLVRTPVAKALPVELRGSGTDEEQIDVDFAFELTDEGVRHPAMTITGDAAQDRSMWQSLPRLKGIVATGPARPGASVLARLPHPLTQGDAGLPVLATQPYGQGMTAVITADTTWRWSRRARLEGRPDTLYVRFWSQFIRWLARRDPGSDSPAITLTTDAPMYRRGEQVRISARRNPAAILPMDANADATIHMVVRTPDGRQTELPAATGSSPNQWNATFHPARGGRFEVTAALRAVANGASGDVASQSVEFLVEGSNLELDDPAPSPTAMAQLARLTGGAYADLDRCDRVADMIDRIPAEPRLATRTERASLWNNPGLFLFFLACVSAEWIARRRNQLV